MGWSVTAAKRDVVDASTDYDFTGTIMNAYLEGRTLITNQAPLADILVQEISSKYMGKGCCGSFNPLYK